MTTVLYCDRTSLLVVPRFKPVSDKVRCILWCFMLMTNAVIALACAQTKYIVALNIEISELKRRPHLPCQRYYPQFVRLCVVTSIRDNDQRNS